MKKFSGQVLPCFFPVFIVVSFWLTILAGFAGTLLPSLNYLPVIGHTRLSLCVWADFFTYPGIWTSVFVTAFSGLGASIGVVGFAGLFVCFAYGTRLWQFFETILSPILSIPHAAFAIGFGFLMAPSGWLMRLVSPALTGFTAPPDWIILNDPAGISLATALLIKEFPFLIMVTLGALGQLEIEKTVMVGRALGYEKEQIWLKILVPRLYPHLRLSIFAVIAYSLSVADMAIILGPSSPPSLSVLILTWFNDPDVTFKLLAAAGSLFLFFMVGLSLLGVFVVEKTARIVLSAWITNGQRRFLCPGVKPMVRAMASAIIVFTLLSSLVLFFWSFTWQWRFPDVLPATWSLTFWKKGVAASFDPLMVTLVTGVAAALIGLILVVGCLEAESMAPQPGTKNRMSGLPFVVYLPLLVPQITFMAGIQLLLVIIKMDGYWISLLWSHLLFVLPYMFIALSATYRAFDKRITDQARLLRRSYGSALFRVKLPLLLKPILFAFAIGFAVSVAQYIPTIMVGAGRFSTITTQVVAIASGSDRRAAAVFALIAQALPMIVYALAILFPKILYYNKRGMQV